MTDGSSPQIMIIAGEVSGDMHAAKLVRAVKKSVPSATFFGTGGSAMEREGVEILQDFCRSDQELVGPAIELVTGRQRRTKAATRVAAEQLEPAAHTRDTRGRIEVHLDVIGFVVNASR